METIKSMRKIITNLKSIKNLYVFRFLKDEKDPDRITNKKNIKGETPLYVACRDGHLEVILSKMRKKNFH